MALLDHLRFLAACLAQLSGEAFVHGPCFAVYSLLCVEASRLNLEAMMFVDGVPGDRNTFPWDKSKDLAKQTATRNSSKKL